VLLSVTSKASNISDTVVPSALTPVLAAKTFATLPSLGGTLKTLASKSSLVTHLFCDAKNCLVLCLISSIVSSLLPP
jgi:hypothetical protein